jgi:hypothetical protein
MKIGGGGIDWMYDYECTLDHRHLKCRIKMSVKHVRLFVYICLFLAVSFLLFCASRRGGMAGRSRGSAFVLEFLHLTLGSEALVAGKE